MAKRPRLAANMQTSPGAPVRAPRPLRAPEVRTPEALVAEVATAFVAEAHPVVAEAHPAITEAPIAEAPPAAPAADPQPRAEPAAPRPTPALAPVRPAALAAAADTLPAILGDAVLAMSQASLANWRQAMVLQARLSAVLMTPPRFPGW